MNCGYKSRAYFVALVFGIAAHLCLVNAADDEKRPSEHRCPITLEVMRDPVVAADGQSYEREAISKWFITSQRSPITNVTLAYTTLTENISLKKMISDWVPGRSHTSSVLGLRPASEIAKGIRREFERNEALLHSAREQHIVAFLGNTGAGKSTLVNLLAGKKLIITSDEEDYVLADPDDTTAMAIGIGGQSETLYPKSIDINIEGTRLRFFDFPGFNDTDGSERNLVNAAFMRQILLEAESVRLIFVAGQDQFTADRSASVKQMFSSIKQLFVIEEQEKDLVNEGIFVATKVTSNDSADVVSTLLKKTDSRDKEELHTQLQSWAMQDKLCRMPHPIRKEDLISIRAQVLGLIKNAQPVKVRGINVSVLYPTETTEPLKRMFEVVMQEILDPILARRVAMPLTTLSEYDDALANSSVQEFWKQFDSTVCTDDKSIALLKEFCINPYTEAMKNIERKNTKKFQEHVQDLESRKQKRIKDIKEKTDKRAQEVLSSLDPRQNENLNNGYFAFGHPQFYEQICGENYIGTLATDPKEQDIVRESYARFISCHSYEQMMRWQKRLSIIPEIARGHEDVYIRFLSGKLIYKPDPNSDNGRIELPIRALTNPLEGTFDLSQCGDTGQSLSIATGYRKAKKTENANKIEIWLTPRFLVERNLTTTAAHFRPIMSAWNEKTAPVGILWNLGSWELDLFDYVTTSFDQLSDEHLYKKCLHHGERPCFTSRGLCGDYRHRSCFTHYEQLHTTKSACFIFDLK